MGNEVVSRLLTIVLAGKDLGLVSLHRLSADDTLEHIFGTGVAFLKNIVSPSALILAHEVLHDWRVQVTMNG